MPRGRQTPPSYHQDFARYAGESEYPNRWRTLRGAWVPALGQTGFTLRDVTSRKIDGDLTNMEATDWIISGNPREPGYALEYGGTNEFTQIGNTSDFAFMHKPNEQFTVALWMRLPTPEPDSQMVLVATHNGGSAQIGFALAFDDQSSVPRSRRLFAEIDRGVGGQGIVFSITADNAYPNDSNWHRIVWTWNHALASNNSHLYVDALDVKTDSKTVHAPSTADSLHELHLASKGNETNLFTGDMGSVIIDNRAWTPGEVVDDFADSLAFLRLRDRLAVKAPAAAGISIPVIHRYRQMMGYA